jgi:uncharacterized cupin superfamily protein
MKQIQVIHKPTKEQLERQGVTTWPIWTKEASEFPWTYDEQETCYFLEGDVVVTPKGGQPVEIRAGDLVTFPQGMECTWTIRKPVRKHYLFGD